ncbi:MAG: hypothetical protein IT424_16150 [Pirellulales bacterium]|nr:hypothetical protein [Pirellulales bacterium]
MPSDRVLTSQIWPAAVLDEVAPLSKAGRPTMQTAMAHAMKGHVYGPLRGRMAGDRSTRAASAHL